MLDVNNFYYNRHLNIIISIPAFFQAAPHIWISLDKQESSIWRGPGQAVLWYIRNIKSENSLYANTLLQKQDLNEVIKCFTLANMTLTSSNDGYYNP